MSMRRDLVFFAVAAMAFAIVSGSVLEAGAEVYQSKIIAIKQGTAGSFSSSDLSGKYWFRRLLVENVEAADPAQREATVAYGYIDFDGQGGHTGSFTDFDSDGETENGSFSGSYDVETNGAFSFIINGDPAQIYGHISSDRNVLILSDGGDFYGQPSHGIVIAVKAPPTALQISDLDGTWGMGILQIHDFEKPIDTDITVCSLILNLDGLGDWDGTYACFDGDGSSNSGQALGTYTLNSARNAFHIYTPEEPEPFLSAYLSRDKRILIFTQGQVETDTDIEESIATALKMDPTKRFTNADLAGKFWFRELAIVDMLTSNRQASVSWGWIEFDGKGGFIGGYTSYWSYDDTESGSISGTYVVNCDGSFKMTPSDSGGIVFYGNVSSDGNTATLTTPGVEGEVGPCVRSNPALPLLLLDK